MRLSHGYHTVISFGVGYGRPLFYLLNDEVREMRWDNPWKDTEGFIDLGPLNIGGIHPILADLYVFPGSNGKTLHFGGRHSDEGCDYTSGDCYKSNGKWIIRGGLVIQTAAARYFANYHSAIKE